MFILKNKTQGNFTMISNRILADKELTLKDRGLLCTLFSYPDNWNFSIQGLTTLIPDGKTSISAALNHLAELGYIKFYRTRNSKGQFMSIIEITYEKNPGHPDLENDSIPASDNPERKTRRGKSASDNQPQYNTNNIKTKDNTKNTIINHSILNERNEENPKNTSLIAATKRRVNYDLMLKTLSISELAYAERILTLITAYISNEQLKSSLKISGQYVQPDQAISYLLKYRYDEIYTVSKNMANSQIPLDKPDSYYFSALEKQYQINNPDGEEFNDYFFDN